MSLSESRIRIARVIDQLYVRGIKLFDLGSLNRFELWIAKFARKKLYEKVQTLFQMGKRQEFLELLSWLEREIPELKRLANNPDVLMTVSGKLLNEESTRRFWLNRPIPKDVQEFVNGNLVTET